MPFSLKISKNVNSTTRNLKSCYILIFICVCVCVYLHQLILFTTSKNLFYRNIYNKIVITGMLWEKSCYEKNLKVNFVVKNNFSEP